MINCRVLKFPHRAVVLLVLESDGACTGLSGRSARTSAVLVSVWCYTARGEREEDLQRYKPPESCIKKWYDKPSGYGCCSKKCEQGNNETMTLLYLVPCLKHSDIQWKHKIQNVMIITTDQNPHFNSIQFILRLSDPGRVFRPRGYRTCQLGYINIYTKEATN